MGALEGITVVECSTFVTGPYAAQLLADLGARVIKIEPPPDGDPYRYFASDRFYSPNFAHLNRNKESIVLNLKTEPGKRISRELLRTADVFVENFRPGVADELGLGYAALKSINRRLVYCSISAFGRTGPYADDPGFDTLGQAMSGLMSLLTDLDQPQVLGVALSDYVTGLSAAYGILGSLIAREKTGSGLRIETSLLEATLSFIGETAADYLRTGRVPTRMARVRNALAFAFLDKDRRPFVIHCSVPEKFWLGLLKAANRLELARDKRFQTRQDRIKNYDELCGELRPIFAARTRAEWIRALKENDVPAGPINTIEETLADPQVSHLGMVREVEHPTVGNLQFVRSAVTYPELPEAKMAPPPIVGEHTAGILAELGFSLAQVDELEKQGIVKTRRAGGFA
jgi:crotonobetainyl-CoA:carnitine CoA-transferase CaiB-like acyl-CoA transferase